MEGNGLNRKLYNVAIVEKLRELVNKYPDLRFGQILVNADIIELDLDPGTGVTSCRDPYYEEPEYMWERMKNNKFAFKELFN